MALDKRLIRNIDFSLIFFTLLALVVGCVMIYSATRYNDSLTGGDPFYYVNKQIIAAVLGFVVAAVAMLVDYRYLGKMSKLIYFASIVFLLSVFVLGTRTKGAINWIRIGPLALQPSEFTKYGFVVALAAYLTTRDNLSSLKDLIVPFLIAAVPTGIVILQNDLGSALVFPAVLFVMLFVAGADPKLLLSILGLGIFVVAPIAYFFFLSPYQQNRILVFFNPGMDPTGAGYNVLQSLTTIGSGGLFGKGLGNSTQARLNFLPAHHTDFIFSIVAEELGFIGAVLVLVMLFAIVRRGMVISRESKDRFGSLVAIGITAIFLVHILINVGMTMNLSPCTGIPLPFFSAGGSSLIASLLGIGMLESIYMRRQKLIFN